MARLGKTNISGIPILKDLVDKQEIKYDAAFLKFLKDCRDVAKSIKK